MRAPPDDRFAPRHPVGDHGQEAADQQTREEEEGGPRPALSIAAAFQASGGGAPVVASWMRLSKLGMS